MPVPTNENKTPKLQVFITEHTNGQMEFSIKRMPGMMTDREFAYANAIRKEITRQLPAIIQRLDKLKAVVRRHPPGIGPRHGN